MCSRASCSTQNISLIMCFRVHAQHKYFINHVLQVPRPTQLSYISICIINNCLMPNIQNKSSCSYGVGSSTQYIKINYQDNIIINRPMSRSVRSKIRDITMIKERGNNNCFVLFYLNNICFISILINLMFYV